MSKIMSFLLFLYTYFLPCLVLAIQRIYHLEYFLGTWMKTLDNFQITTFLFAKKPLHNKISLCALLQNIFFSSEVNKEMSERESRRETHLIQCMGMKKHALYLGLSQTHSIAMHSFLTGVIKQHLFLHISNWTNRYQPTSLLQN